MKKKKAGYLHIKATDIPLEGPPQKVQPVIHQVAAWPLQMAMIGLVFATLAIGAFSTVILVEIAGDVTNLSATMSAAVRSRDAHFRSVEKKIDAVREDAAAAAAADTLRDEQIDLLWKHVGKLERRK